MFYEVILDSGETANKCTIVPLSYRLDFRLFRVKGADALGPLASPILLHHEGVCLTEIRKTHGPVEGIASIDCIWRRLDTLVRRIAPGPAKGTPLLARIPEGFVTAYPRRSADNSDPDAGLATIEAIFVAAAVLGEWDISLFSEYYFGRKFLELNARRFLELGVSRAADADALLSPPQRPRHALQRRVDRGRKLFQ